ncbi:MAG TPA: PEGA domain-containing protein [Candidatus Saccharimonadales bacterium]|nr:PEGA domain-containing protein [Candidatus Saccharimonadales bacterium]
MDYLDPRKQRAYKIRLMVGYFLTGCVLVLATLILVYGAYGYGINTKTGQIIENGLLFVGSQPGGAQIYLNGKLQSSTTSARFVLPAKKYTLTLKKAGYRSWQRSFILNAHAIERYDYPFLFPTQPRTFDLKDYDSLPALVTQTPDYHWLIVEQPASTSATVSFDEFDTSNLAAQPLVLNLPADLLTDADSSASTLKVVEWSSDNKHLLLEHDYAGGQEFIVFDRTDPTKSFNINKLFKINPTQVALRNKSVDQLYLYDGSAQTLQVADTTQNVLAPAFLKHVLAFKPYGDSLMTYVTDENMPSGQVQARIWNNGQTYPLYTFKAGTHYLINAAQYSGHWYYVAGSDTSRINIYEDPLSDIANPKIGKAIPVLGFDDLGATQASFSNNARFIGIEAAQTFAVYDFEAKQAYRYTVKQPLSGGQVSWMDGDRWIGQSGTSVFVFDYDYANPQMVTPSVYSGPAFFSANYQQMITFTAVPNSSGVTLERVDMRAGTDLPKNGAQ